MDSQEVSETNMAFHRPDGVDDMDACTSYGNGFKSKRVGVGVEHSDDLGDVVLEDWDTMMEDLDDGVRIARMVSDSVMKGMVSAVQQEADEKLKAKDLEIARLKLALQFYNMNEDQKVSWWLEGIHESEAVEVKGYASFEDACLKHEKMENSLLVLRKSATDQLKRLRKQIKGLGGCKIKRNGSCNEMVGLGGILKEEYENGAGLEKTIDNLELTMNNISRMVDTVLKFSKESLSEWQQEHVLKGELEDMIMKSSVKCIQEEFQNELLDKKCSCCESQNIVLAEKLNNVSDLRNEINALTKLLPSSESGHLVSYSSLDADNTHGNSLRSQLPSRWEEKGKSDKSILGVPDSFDAHQLSHMNKEQLVQFFNNTILSIKREGESKLHEVTDKYITLKGKYLSERKSISLPTKDFEILRRKIPEVVSKLDGILSESDEFIRKGDSVASISILNNSVNTLLRENRQLRDSLAVKEEEVKHLSSQLSADSEKMLRHTSFMEDACIEASIIEDVYKCVIRELTCQIHDTIEESELQIIAMQDIYKVLLDAANVDARNASECATKDTFMESLFMQEMLGTLFKETLTDTEQKFENLHREYKSINGQLVSLEKKAKAREVELRLETEESGRLKSEVHSLRNVVEEKEELARELAKEKQQFEIALGEHNNLRKQASLQETLVSQTNKELYETSDKLSKAQLEINTLSQKLELAMEDIKASSDYKNTMLALSKEKQNFMLLIEAKEKEHRKQMEEVVVLVDELSSKFVDFESRVTMDIVNNNSRLEKARSLLSSFIKAVSVLNRTALLFNQNLERKTSDLQLAEDEVDLLGDEVETLLGLLEKIYIALDHYSPVLQHYPGVIEILELVRRELSGEALKAH